MNRNPHGTPAQQLGEMIAAGREQQGLDSQAKLAAALNASQGLVSKWERGLHVPSSSHLSNLIRLLRLDPEEVYDLVYRATRGEGIV